MNKKENKKSIWITLGGLVGILTLISFLLDYMGLWDLGKSKPTIYTDKISVSYLNTNNNLDNIYMLFDDEIDNKKEYKLSESCATQLFITNYYEDEIILNSIRFIAEEISVIEEPIISLLVLEGNGFVDLQLYNIGWADSDMLNLTFEGVNDDLSKHIDRNKLSLSIEGIPSQTSKTIRLWENEDLITDMDSGVIKFTATCNDAMNNTVETVYGETRDFSHLEVDIADGKFVCLGKGGISDLTYGVRIDTSQPSFNYEETIRESIQSQETLALPICFFPDKSCSIRFHIEFSALHNGKQTFCQSDPVTLEFEVSSINTAEKYNAGDYSTLELTQIANDYAGSCIISYPFINKKYMQFAN